MKKMTKRTYPILLTSLFLASFLFSLNSPPAARRAFAADNIFTDKIGIGTTGPAATLEILSSNSGGQARFIRSVTGGTQMFLFDSQPATNMVAIEAEKTGGAVVYPTLAFYNSGAAKMVIDNSGYVGIGTTTPSKKLYIDGAGDNGAQINGTTNVSLGITSTSADSYSFLYLVNDARQWSLINDGALSDIFKIRDSTAGLDRFVINSSGYLGIGTTGPAYRLDVVNGQYRFGQQYTSTQAGFMINNSVTAVSGAAVGLDFRNDLTAAANDDILSQINFGGSVYAKGAYTGLKASQIRLAGSNMDVTGAGTVSDAALIWVVNAPTVGTNNYALKIDAGTSYFGGNVGIGTTGPGTNLDVLRAAGGQAIRATSGAAATTGITLSAVNAGDTLLVGMENSAGGGNFGGTSAYAGVLGVTGAHSLQFATNNTAQVTINSSGYVGIGSTIPAYKLDVAGDIRATGTVYGALNGGALSATTGTFTGNVIISKANARLTLGNAEAGPGNIKFNNYPTVTNWLLTSQYINSNTFEIIPSTAVGGDTFSTAALSIQSGGNVGIGTGVPGYLLTLNDASNSLATQLGFGYSGTWTHTIGRANTTGLLEFVALTNNNGFRFSSTAPAAHGDFIVSNMDVGIGTSTARQVFDVVAANSIFSGNVGIGTAGPTAPLHSKLVDNAVPTAATVTSLASLRLSGGTGQHAGQMLFGSSGPSDNQYWIQVGKNDVAGDSPTLLIGYTLRLNPLGGAVSLGGSLNVDGTGNSYIQGNVGIGTASPSAGAGGNMVLHITGSAPTIRLEDTNASSGLADYDIWAANGYLAIYDNDASAYRMFINSTGKVGIGTGGPDYNLDVMSSAAEYPTLRIKSLNTGGYAPQIRLSTYGYSGSPAAYFDILRIETGYTGAGGSYTNFLTKNQPESSEVSLLYFNHNTGRVGIGTAGPSNILHVRGNQPSIRIQNSGTQSADPSMLSYADFRDQIHVQLGTILQNDGASPNYNSDFTIRTHGLGAGGFTDAVYIKSGGNVGIGTTNPSNGKLQVNGEISTGQDGLRWKIYTGTTNSDGSALSIASEGTAFNANVVGASCRIVSGNANPHACVWGYPNVVGDANTATLTVHSDGNIYLYAQQADYRNQAYKCVVFYID